MVFCSDSLRSLYVLTREGCRSRCLRRARAAPVGTRLWTDLCSKELRLAAQGLTGQLCSTFVDAERLAGSAGCPSEKIVRPVPAKAPMEPPLSSTTAITAVVSSFPNTPGGSGEPDARRRSDPAGSCLSDNLATLPWQKPQCFRRESAAPAFDLPSKAFRGGRLSWTARAAPNCLTQLRFREMQPPKAILVAFLAFARPGAARHMAGAFQASSPKIPIRPAQVAGFFLTYTCCRSQSILGELYMEEHPLLVSRAPPARRIAPSRRHA